MELLLVLAKMQLAAVENHAIANSYVKRKYRTDHWCSNSNVARASTSNGNVNPIGKDPEDPTGKETKK